MSVSLAMLLDRMSVTKQIFSHEHYLQMKNHAWTLVTKKAKDEAPYHLRIVKEEFKLRLSYYPDKGDLKRLCAVIVLDSNPQQYEYFHLTLLMSKFAPGEFLDFQKLLRKWFGVFNWANLFKSGRVSEVEIAIDFLTQPHFSFIPFAKYFQHSEINNTNGELGTVYIGARESPRRYRIYDKHRQLVQTGKSWKWEQHTRIEVSHEPDNKLAPHELTTKYMNPFLRLEIADLETANKLPSHWQWMDFLKRCVKGDGAVVALRELEPVSLRPLFNKKLRMAAAPWWDPKKMWEQRFDTFAVILPASDEELGSEAVAGPSVEAVQPVA